MITKIFFIILLFCSVNLRAQNLTQSYLLQNVCGLNFTQVSVLTETRTQVDTFNTNGTGFPTNLNLSGLPFSTCPSIIKAFIYYGCSYSEGTPPVSSVTILNPAGNLTTISSSMQAKGAQVCWGERGTAFYSADVTSLISGNGNYSLMVNGFANPAWEIDGVTLFVIYSDPAATYSGSIALFDGIKAVSYGSVSSKDKNFTVCSATNSAKAFGLLGDMQANVGTGMNTEVFNGVTDSFPNLVWNYCEIPVSLYAGQDSVSFISQDSLDCYFSCLNGLYWQNTNCISCVPATPTLTLTIAANAVTCGNNGSASVNVSGATGPLTYTWYPDGQTTSSLSTLLPGTYTVYVSDGNSCAGDTITVMNTGMALNISSSPEYCTNAGTAAINAIGGISPYTYSWSNGATTSAITGITGGYSVTVTDNVGCSIMDTTTIFYTTPIKGYLYGSPPIACPPTTGTFSAVVYGGTAPYTYLWSPGGETTGGITGITGGSFTVNVTDSAGCLLILTDSVSPVPNLLNLVCFNLSPYYCSVLQGSGMAITYGGTSPYTYSWSPGGQTADSVGGLSAGTYTVTVTDANGCTATCTEVVATEIISDSIQWPYNTINAGDTMWLNGGCNVQATYHWAPSNFVNYPDSQYVELFPDTTTTFTLTVTTPCGTDYDTLTIFVTGCANPFIESLCIVTVDSNSKYDEIIWEHFNSPPSGDYLIFRESSSSSYSFIASQPVSMLSYYIDSTSHPELGPISYEICTSDSCGLSGYSLPHTSLFLTDTAEYHVNILNWTAYVGFVPSKYLIFRGLSLHTMVAIDSVPSAVLTYHDTLPPSSVVYSVQAVNPSGPCIPTTHVVTHGGSGGSTLVSRSNVRKLKNITGISEITGNSSDLYVFPNPTNGIFTIALGHSELVSESQTIDVFNELGECVLKETPVRTVHPGGLRGAQGDKVIDLSAQPNGIYTLRLQTENGIEVKKIVIMH